MALSTCIEKIRKSGYTPLLFLFAVALLVGLLTYQQYGISWDETLQRDCGLLSYEYIFHNDQSLFKTFSDNHGAGFELPLVINSKKNILSSLPVPFRQQQLPHS